MIDPVSPKFYLNAEIIQLMVNIIKLRIMADEKLEKAAEEEDQTDLWDPTLPRDHPYYNFTKKEVFGGCE